MPTQKKIKSPEELGSHFEDYRVYNSTDFLYETIPNFKTGGYAKVPKERALTFEGFQRYLRKHKIICNLHDYKANTDNRYSEYASIIRDIQQECDADQFDKASTGLLKENIISRRLGYSEKRDHSGSVTVNFKDAE